MIATAAAPNVVWETCYRFTIADLSEKAEPITLKTSFFFASSAILMLTEVGNLRIENSSMTNRRKL